ncbi:Sodium/potassium-transporting ATPase subunit beta [Melipona quadrifasciata]|uniref:Sodium/potassium-transporting ATPase subunit beta n=1 Tax=Melipona quadrifasciata TaxID=166423 RepID=A0A0N0BE64_9HYME|nr:Sodium/potassium-transporting ATPase subunit beta [Melipona quadrifasciata]
MEGKKVEQFYTPPPKLGKWEGFRVFLWNSETGQFLGRTGASWDQCVVKYRENNNGSLDLGFITKFWCSAK